MSQVLSPGRGGVVEEITTMSIDAVITSIVESTQSLIREPQHKIAELLGRTARARAPHVEQVAHDSISPPVSSEGHAGPGGQKGGSLDVTA